MIKVAALILLTPAMAMAYVDPGVVPMLFQLFYVVSAGVVAFVFIKPWGFIKAWVAKLRGAKKDAEQAVSTPESQHEG